MIANRRKDFVIYHSENSNNTVDEICDWSILSFSRQLHIRKTF